MGKNRKVIIGLAAGVTVAGLVITAAQTSMAAEDQANSLVEKVAERFNLKADEVQQVFDQDRAERRAEMDKHYEERLSLGVKEGKLTEEQKSKLVAKHKELAGKMSPVRPGEARVVDEQTRQKRREEVKKLKDESRAWEKLNNIPPGYLWPGHKIHVGRHGMMKGV